MGTDDIVVTIEYLRTGSTVPARVVLAADEYFEAEEMDVYDVDSVPRHMHAREYLGLSREALEYTVLTISGPRAGTRTIRERYWKGGVCSLAERHDDGPAGRYAEVILETPGSGPGNYQIVRLVLLEGFYVPCSHVVVSDQADGTQTEEVIFSDPSLSLTRG